MGPYPGQRLRFNVDLSDTFHARTKALGKLVELGLYTEGVGAASRLGYGCNSSNSKRKGLIGQAAQA